MRESPDAERALRTLGVRPPPFGTSFQVTP